MGDDGQGTYSNIITGLQWVGAHVAAGGWRGVVNMSLGGEPFLTPWPAHEGGTSLEICCCYWL